ncbi:DUF4465 domain-containing protein [Saccharicrinis aurantiacus]|uniref:DUF4465 domain-containing protein n=1 Tax=Saccharicrinis aurantiacus TaxID=1849719 RepID=UPI00094F8168|nr:DUF4465 domain-containing protein [Saccharicrinis aurantiacus]
MKLYISLIILTAVLSFSSCEDQTREIPVSEIYSDMPEDGYEVEIDSSFVLYPKITYDYDSQYSWYSHEEDQIISNQLIYEREYNELGTFNYTFSLNNDRGSATYNYIITSLFLTDFDELDTLSSNSFWDAPNNETSFTSGETSFSLVGKPDLVEEWYGFTFSNLSGARNDVNQSYFSMNSAPTEYSSKIFAVLKQDPSLKSSFITFDENKEHLVKSISVNNTYGTRLALEQGTKDEEGNELSKKFGGDGTEKDLFTLNIIGHKADGSKTEPIEFYMADYTFDAYRDNYIIRDWTTINLESLGLITKLELVLHSTDMDDEDNMRTPASICIDQIKITE